ncbi:Methylated-DNA--protein-cysteine methyltransferase OS=Castellaniella defragrans OX=75697 GN=HNR28_002403 PE=3 SV=1 [Castellaniella defragrans]
MTTVFHAIVPSPLGDILLRADAGHLLGLYFVGQRDCPDLPGQPPLHPTHFDPAAGTTRGRPTRSLKAVPPASAEALSGDLFGAGALSGSGEAAHLVPAEDPAAALRLQQGNTPMQRCPC